MGDERRYLKLACRSKPVRSALLEGARSSSSNAVELVRWRGLLDGTVLCDVEVFCGWARCPTSASIHDNRPYRECEGLQKQKRRV